MEALVTAFFDKFIQDTFGKNPDLVRFFKDHERKPLCIRRLLPEIMACEKKLKRKFTAKRLEEVTRDIARMFCEACLKAQDFKTASAAAKSLIGKDEAEVAAFEEQFNKDVAADERGRFSRSMEGYGIKETKDSSRSFNS